MSEALTARLEEQIILEEYRARQAAKSQETLGYLALITGAAIIGVPTEGVNLPPEVMVELMATVRAGDELQGRQ